MMVMVIGKTIKNNEIWFPSVASPNEITYVFKILNIFQTANQFSREQINTLKHYLGMTLHSCYSKYIEYFKNMSYFIW